MFKNLFRRAPKSGDMDYRGDYGDAYVPPFPDAEAILWNLTKIEKVNFNDLLSRIQDFYSAGGPVKFHPEARGAFWGSAFAKIADHYHEVGDNRRALFFTTSAWKLCKYPVFAYNSGMLSLALGDRFAAHRYFESYLDDYEKVLTNPIFEFLQRPMTAEQLEEMAEKACLVIGARYVPRTHE